MPLGDSSRRMHVAFIAVAIALSLCAGRLLQLQGFDSATYSAIAAKQLTQTLPLLPARGEITDRNGVVLASTEAAVAITADPTLTTPNADKIADIMSKYVTIDRPAVLAALTRPKTQFAYVQKKVPALVYSKIAADLAAADIPGIYRLSDPIRTYPNGSVGASVVGFVGADGKGLGGFEWSMNKELAGVEGTETYEAAPNGGKIPLGDSKTTPVQNGLNYSLTLDSELQWVAEKALAARVRATGAHHGMAIVLNIKTGEVLAMANAPTYDSADPAAADADNRGNRAVSAPYEPGSVEKVLTAAAVMDSGATVGGQPITPDTQVTIPPLLKSGPLSIKDAFKHQELHYLLRGVIADSSNIGAALFARQMPKAELRSYLSKFGLGRPTGVELPGEAAGILPDPDMPDYTRDQIAFGQGLAVTAIQEASAIAGIVNGGLYHAPTVIKSATDGDGNPVALPARPSRQIVSTDTSAKVRDLMQAVTDSHNGRQNLQIDGWNSGGKTGTAQLANAKCKCYKGYVTSYIAVAPMDDPQLLTYVVVSDAKRGGSSGTAIAAPVVKSIMQYALPRYSIPQTTTKHKVKPIEWGPMSQRRYR
ncbi:peptidoglycan D,D-transpeptidase FtsI family protein [Microlunatus ginsengisoli]|uniref:peptidoglycan D,D-transpeptidase FtsI family protein n=1 Tax=Microlunatus ginsengisoli TaxID=363863 RepID=UPI0031DEE00D